MAILVVAVDHSVMVKRAKDAFDKINSWIRNKNIQMAEEKTEYTQLAGMRGTRLSQILLGQKLIILVNSIKYLGVILDFSHTFKAHVGYACSKAIGIINALHPIMKKTGPANMKARRLIRNTP